MLGRASLYSYVVLRTVSRLLERPMPLAIAP